MSFVRNRHQPLLGLISKSNNSYLYWPSSLCVDICSWRAELLVATKSHSLHFDSLERLFHVLGFVRSVFKSLDCFPSSGASRLFEVTLSVRRWSKLINFVIYWMLLNRWLILMASWLMVRTSRHIFESQFCHTLIRPWESTLEMQIFSLKAHDIAWRIDSVNLP